MISKKCMSPVKQVMSNLYLLNTDLEQTDNQIRDPSAISGNLK